MISRKMTLKIKLLSSFGVFAAVALYLGIVGLNSLQEVSQIYSVISLEATPSLNRIYKMNVVGAKMQESMQSLFLNSDAPDIVIDEMVNFRKLRDELESIRQTETSKQVGPSSVEAMKSVSETWKKISDQADKILKSLETGDATERSKALRVFSTEYTRDMNEFEKHLQNLLEIQNQSVTQQTVQAQTLVSQRNRLISILLGVGFLFAIVVGYLIALSLGKLVKSIQNVTQNLTVGSENLSTAALELSAASQQIASGATAGADSLEQTAASLEELSAMVKVNVASASEAAKLSQQSNQSASASEAQIGQLNAAMEEMKSSSRRIAEIVNVIDDIAFQTNLLALNAAVEAARAGEQGKGFAVVADAVRSLSLRSSTAAKDIQLLINENMQSTEQGGSIVEQSGIAFKSIINLIKKVAVLNEEIAKSSENQEEGLLQINKSMTQLDSIMQDSSSTAEEASTSSNRLTEQAHSLRNTIKDLNNVISGNNSESRAQVIDLSPAKQSRPTRKSA